MYFLCCDVFFFKQKTAYEMRISDRSSDVCSSDLVWCDVSRIAATFYADEKGDDAEGIAEAATVRVERGRHAYSLYVGREPDEGDEGQVAVGGYNGWAVAEARVSAATAVDDIPINLALGQNKSDRVWKPQATTWGA